MSSPKPSKLRSFRIGTKRDRRKIPVSPASRTKPLGTPGRPQEYNIPDRFDFQTERKIYGGLPGSKVKAHYQHVPARLPTLKGIIAALKQVKSPTFSIRVLGKLKETPEDYDAKDFPPHQWLYLGAIRDTADALDDALSIPAYLREQPDIMLNWVNKWSTTDLGGVPGWQWEEVATVYISER